MVSDGRYISDEPSFKRYAYTALRSRFPEQAAFERFYESLADSAIKDEFLRITSFYLFLVKQGEWHVVRWGRSAVITVVATARGAVLPP